MAGTVHSTGPARAPQTDRYVGPGWGIDDLQKHYSRLNLVALRPHYDLVTLMDHMGSSLDRLEVDQRGRTFPPRAPRRLAATPNRTVSCLHTSIAPLPFVIAQTKWWAMITTESRAQFTLYPRITHTLLQVVTGPHKTSKTSDAHAVGPGRPCRTRVRGLRAG